MRRVGVLVLVLVSLTTAIAPAQAAPPPQAPPQAGEAAEEGPVEGPVAPPPSEPSEPSLEPPPPSLAPDLHEGAGIEFAVPPPELPESEQPTGAPTSLPPPAAPRSLQQEIGKAPSSGGAFVAGGAWMVPLSAYGTVILVQVNRVREYPPYTSEPYIITAGVGLGVIGASMLGMGIYRLVALQKWSKRHRVIATAQGSGLLTSGTMATLVGIGALIGAIQTGDVATSAVAGVMLASAPIQLGVGAHFAGRYRRTGGWRATAYTLGPGGLRLQF